MSPRSWTIPTSFRCDVLTPRNLGVSSAAMEAFLCPRHHAIASNLEHGYPYCVGCFREAVAKADDILLEASMRAVYARYHETERLRVRLRWEP